MNPPQLVNYSSSEDETTTNAALPLPAPAQPIPARVRRSGIQGAPRRRGRAGPQLQPQEEVPAAGELMAAIARAALR